MGQMPPRPRRSFNRPRSQRRKLVWADLQIDTTVGVGNYVAYDLLANYKLVAGAGLAGATVARVHGRTWVTSAVVVGDGLSDAVIVDQQDEAQAAPGAALGVAHGLSPSTSPNADWMLYRQWNVHPHYSFNGAVDQWETDIRSKRRLGEVGETLLYVIENRDASATASMSFHFRSLLMLP